MATVLRALEGLGCTSSRCISVEYENLEYAPLISVHRNDQVWYINV